MLYSRLLSVLLANLFAIGLAQASPVCDALKNYPRQKTEKLSFEKAELTPLCKPFVKFTRPELDRCGNQTLDPYVSHYTWPSRLEMAKRGKGNLFSDNDLHVQREALLTRIEEWRARATQLCCADDQACGSAMAHVEVDLCKPNENGDQPDPCVFGGSYRMPGAGYDALFRSVLRHYSATTASEIRKIASRNLSPQVRLAAATGPDSINEKDLLRGSIVLTSYVSRNKGVAPFEPIVLHEFGHACSMVRMQQAALGGAASEANLARASRATEWLDQAKFRCKPDLEPSEAYNDFWESVGETHELASCLKEIAVLNQKQMIDRACADLCPGHYMEESVGIAFSLLTGDLTGKVESVFPNTCDHTRDAQHPLVADVIECLAQNSPRFRDRLKIAYNCH